MAASSEVTSAARELDAALTDLLELGATREDKAVQVRRLTLGAMKILDALGLRRSSESE